jgi:hypothetical protein
MFKKINLNEGEDETVVPSFEMHLKRQKHMLRGKISYRGVQIFGHRHLYNERCPCCGGLSHPNGTIVGENKVK